MIRRAVCVAALAVGAVGPVVAAKSVLVGSPSTELLQSCRWAWPIGQERYIGTTEDALQRMSEVLTAREQGIIRQAIAEGRVTARIAITKTGITASDGIELEPGVALMHFGLRKVCIQVDRSPWPASAVAPGDLYAVPGSRVGWARADGCGNWFPVLLKQPYCPPADPRRTFAQRLGMQPVPAPCAEQDVPDMPARQEAIAAIRGQPSAWVPPSLDLTLPAAPLKGFDGQGAAAPSVPASGPHRVSEPGGLAIIFAALLAVAAASRAARRRKAAA